MSADVFVFGTGCSGTTMLYSLLQSIFGNLYGSDYYSTYEPFIWDKEKFNRPYKQAGSLFGKTSSTSIAGMHNHLKTPLFVHSADRDEYINNDFFRHFSASAGPGQPHLAKFIRANGRMSIFRALNPQARFVLMLRSPVSNINCAKHKFAFYGEDFYPSDYPRFCRQLTLENKLILTPDAANWAQKQAEYCYQMNRAAIEFAVADSNTMILEYDRFAQDKPASLAGLCEFLKTPVADGYVEQLNQPSGPVSSWIKLSQAEYEAVWPYEERYTRACTEADLVRGQSVDAVQQMYNGKCSSSDFDPETEAFTSNRLRRIIRKQNDQIHQLERRLRDIEQG